MDRAAAIELGTDHIFVPVLFHGRDVGIEIMDGKVSETTLEAEHQGVRQQDILYAIGASTVYPEDDTSIQATLSAAIASSTRPLKLVFRRESPAFTVECERKKLGGSFISSKWKSTNLCLIKGVLTRFEKRTAQDPTDTIALTFDSKVEISQNAGKDNAITIVNGHNHGVGTYAFRDAIVMHKVLERIRDSIKAEQRDASIEILPRDDFIHYLAAHTLIEGNIGNEDNSYIIGVVAAVERSPAGDIVSIDAKFVNGKELKDMKVSEIRQPYSSLSSTQAAKLYEQSKAETEARASKKGFRRSMSSKKSRKTIPGWMSAKEAKKMDALFIAESILKKGQLSKYDGGQLEKNCYAVVAGYLVVFSEKLDESEGDMTKLRDACKGAYRLCEVSHTTVDVDALMINLKYSCGVVVVLKAEGMLAAEDWKRVLLGEVRQDVLASATPPTPKVVVADAVGETQETAAAETKTDSISGLHPDAPIPPYAEAEVFSHPEGKTEPDDEQEEETKTESRRASFLKPMLDAVPVTALKLELKLEGSFKDFEEGGKEKQDELVKDVALNLGVPAEQCVFVSARAGSVIADVKVVADADGGGPSLDELQQKSEALEGVPLAGMSCKGVQAEQAQFTGDEEVVASAPTPFDKSTKTVTEERAVNRGISTSQKRMCFCF